MKNPTFARSWLIGSVTAVALGAVSGAAFAQARTYPHMSDCMTLQNALQKQQCAMQRTPQYTTESSAPALQGGPSGPVELRDDRPVMTLDNGGGGSQSPVVPNTTGAPATSGAAPTWD